MSRDDVDNWPLIIARLVPSPLRPVQQKAIDGGLLTSRRNIIVSAPTNSGKSLIGTLVLLEALRKGKRAILIEPLRALANEQAENLQRQLAAIEPILGSELTVKVTTGDYRIDAEEYSDPAPHAELIVCTPERLDAILRNPVNQAWVESIGAVCLDEAHYISKSRRGITQEFILTSLLLLPSPPRLVLLSATLGDLSKAEKWLAPCDVVRVSERYPPLQKEVLALSKSEEVHGALVAWLTKSLTEPNTQALVFVYRPVFADKLALQLTEDLAALAGKAGALAYHAQMSFAKKESIRQAFLSGQSRVVVTTSALALGVNLPVTHVVVRDLKYWNGESPDLADLIQMMGRAGRGDQEGHAVVITSPNDDWHADDLATQLEEEHIPEFSSALASAAASHDTNLSSSIPVISALLLRAEPDGMTPEGLEKFLSSSLGGEQLIAQVAPALSFLKRKTLTYEEEGCYRLTTLGRRASRAVLPVEVAAGYSQLLRDLMSLDPKDELLRQWVPMDHLLALHLLFGRPTGLRAFSKELAELVISWCERHSSETGLLFREWLLGDKEHSKAEEVFGALGISAPSRSKDKQDWYWRQGYTATFKSIILLERGRGTAVADLLRNFEVGNLAGIEERWRDDFLWLLAGIAKLLEVKCFYYHLREECDADSERIKRIEQLLRRMKNQIYDLMESLKYCSPLGPVFRDIRKLMGGGVGETTIRTLEENGIRNLKDLYDVGYHKMVSFGIRKDIAKKIEYYLKRRAA